MKEAILYVKEIWRYPVKSMAGEPLERARIGRLGLEGDRVFQVRDRQGRIVTARTHRGLLGLRVNLDGQGAPLVGGRPWTDPSVLANPSSPEKNYFDQI